MSERGVLLRCRRYLTLDTYSLLTVFLLVFSRIKQAAAVLTGKDRSYCTKRCIYLEQELRESRVAPRLAARAHFTQSNKLVMLPYLTFLCRTDNDNPLFKDIDCMPEFRPAKKNIPLVSELVSSLLSHNLIVHRLIPLPILVLGAP